MSNEVIFLYDQDIPDLERHDEGGLRFRFHVPTKVLDTLGTGVFNGNSGPLAISALAVVRRCLVTKGLINLPDEPIEGIHLDGGITIVDKTGKQGTVTGKIWTLNDTKKGTPDAILRALIMGESRKLAERVDMIIKGYEQQDDAHSRAIDDSLKRARGDALESRHGTFGRGY